MYFNATSWKLTSSWQIKSSQLPKHWNIKLQINILYQRETLTLNWIHQTNPGFGYSLYQGSEDKEEWRLNFNKPFICIFFIQKKITCKIQKKSSQNSLHVSISLNRSHLVLFNSSWVLDLQNIPIKSQKSSIIKNWKVLK